MHTYTEAEKKTTRIIHEKIGSKLFKIALVRAILYTANSETAAHKGSLPNDYRTAAQHCVSPLINIK